MNNKNITRTSTIEYLSYISDAGKISREIAEKKALTEFEKYRVIQDEKFIGEFELYCLNLIDDKDLEK